MDTPMETPFFLGTKLVLATPDLQASFATDFYGRVFGAEEIARRYVRARFAGTDKSVQHLACVMELPTGERFIVADVVEDVNVDPNLIAKVSRRHGPPPATISVVAPPHVQAGHVGGQPSISPLGMIIFETAEAVPATDRALELAANQIGSRSHSNAFGGPGLSSVVKDPLRYGWQISTPRNA